VEGFLGWEICKTLVYFLFIDLTTSANYGVLHKVRRWMGTRVE